MLKINRLRIEVKTVEGLFGLDNKFDKKINFIASYKNTKGKSSSIEAIYYCLGLEELIGGKGEKALKPVFRDKLIYENTEINVLETEFYLEIVGIDNIVRTIHRTSCKAYHSSNLIRVYHGDIDGAIKGTCTYEDTYVHLAGAASNKRGFHTLLEDMIGLKLPKVPSYDDVDRKLYLQIIFSAIFIEQKRGWAGLFATTPTYLRVRDPQKRAIEYLIGLESLDIEEKRQKCKDSEAYIKKEWELILSNINIILDKSMCEVENINSKPEILNKDIEFPIFKILDDGKRIYIKDYILQLEEKLERLESDSSCVGSNMSKLEIELYNKQDELLKLEDTLIEEKKQYIYEKQNIKSLIESLEAIDLDLENNKDILKIKKLGSTKDWSINDNICPTCNQHIQDILIPQSNNIKVMSIEENIRHLEAQKNMIEFSIKSSKNNELIINSNIQLLEEKIVEYRRVLRSIKNDLYSIDGSISESIVREKILIKNTIEDLAKLIIEVNKLCEKIKILSIEWKDNLGIKNSLPESNFSENDKAKIKNLKDNFIKNLTLFGYKSISDTSKVEISEDKLMPVINGFDIRFDSSASDSVRVIWAFTLALMQTSMKLGGNHPRILIFDEPGQQSMVVSDLINFITELCKLDNETQIIMGITLDDTYVKSTIEQIDKSIINLSLIEDRSISLL